MARPLVVRLDSSFPMDESERRILAAADLEVREVTGSAAPEAAAALADCDAVIIVSSYLRAPLLAAMRKCRVISRSGTGVDKIDVEEATRLGIVVANQPGFSTNEVADHTMALLLSAARQLPMYERSMRAGIQPRDVPSMHRLSAQVLGLVGFGRIGQAVARRAAGFGMTLLAADPALTDAAAAAAGVRRVTLPTLLAASDYVCLLCPLTDATRGMMGAAQIAGMKTGAVLVNTARGELVDEAALAAALSSGRLRHAALDVFAGINVFTPDGRFPTDHPFFGLPNATLTPHVAAASEEAAAEAHEGCAEAVVDVLAGRWPRWPVNPSVTPRVHLAPRAAR